MKSNGQNGKTPEREGRDIYEDSYESSRKKSDELAAACVRVSYLRIAAFAFAGLFLLLGYWRKAPVFFMPVPGLAVAFLALIFYHDRLKKELVYLEDKQSVLGDYIARFGDGWKSFSVDGTRYESDDFLQAKDLDLFGRGSLYQYICTAGTVRGQDTLAGWLRLCGEGFEKERFREIGGRQQAVAELAEKPGFCLELETCARRLRSAGYEQSKEIMDVFFGSLKTTVRICAAQHILLWFVPVLTLAFLFSALIGVYRQRTVPLFLFSAGLQLAAALLGLYRNNRALAPVYRMNRTIAPYRNLFELLERETFESAYLKELQETLLKNEAASAALKELEEISDAVCARRNIYAFVLYNALFLHDYRCVERYEKWKERYGGSLEDWLQAVGKAEALISLLVIRRSREVCCLPEIADCPRPVLDVSDVRHPLLRDVSAVGNDIALTHRTCVITGSNMSGKTTFLRSIGVNLALAYAGGFCTAAAFRVSLMCLCTSIRVEDNVNEGISTFYAELLRIRRMIGASQKEMTMICLIDEIYKGTNSEDRIFAAQETVRRLSKPWAFTLLTTHDFELCDLENDAAADAKNYHFAEYYEENEIRFDYKLRHGRCTTTNARYLLRMAGILDSDIF